MTSFFTGLVFVVCLCMNSLLIAGDVCPLKVSDYLKNNSSNEAMAAFPPYGTIVTPVNIYIQNSFNKYAHVFIHGKNFSKEVKKYPYQSEFGFKAPNILIIELCEKDKQISVSQFKIESKTNVLCVISDKIDCSKI